MSANIDTRDVMQKMEAALAAGDDHPRREEFLTILDRWRWDEQLDAASRDYAAALLAKYNRTYPGQRR